jgi:hypothetical protein
MAVPSSHQSTPAPALAAPAPARVPVSRGERVAAGVVLVAYGVMWAVMLGHGWSVIDAVRRTAAATQAFCRGVIWAGGMLSPRLWEDALGLLFGNLILVMPVLAVPAAARVFGRHGWIRGNLFWSLIGGHSLAFLGLLISILRVQLSWGNGWHQSNGFWIATGANLSVLCLSLYALRLTRARR